MSHSCPNLVSTSFLYNPYIPFLICRIFLFTSLISTVLDTIIITFFFFFFFFLCVRKIIIR